MGGWTIVTTSPRQSQSLGRSLGKLVQGGEIVGLVGEFGAGKTCFVRGFAQGIEVAAGTWVRSPTFTLINEYSGRLPVYHIDLYRVGKQEELETLNLREYLYGDGVSLIEWFEFLPSHEVDDYLELRIAHRGGNKRELTFVAHGQRYEQLLEELKSKSFKGSRVQKFKDGINAKKEI
jgi:tRNA threonylcarbamoyladenosine biosynthesis protein TsaE